jgi:tight adherence protein B
VRLPGRWRRIGPRTSAPGDDPASRIAASVLRLAVLLQAGIAPDAAWRHLARSGDADAIAVEEDRRRGASLADAIAAREGLWRELAAAWRVAVTVGAPLAESLRAVAQVLRESAEVAEDVRVALAEPAATARLMLWLPGVGVLLGVALGFDTFGVLFRRVEGGVLLVAGVALVLAAQRWTRRLVRTAHPPPGIPGLGAELVAVALTGGVSIERAQSLVAGTGVPADDVEGVLALSREAGVPAAELLRAHAAHARHVARTTGRLAAARLSSRLLIPLGVCTLPAFLCLGVAPLMLSVLDTTPL